MKVIKKGAENDEYGKKLTCTGNGVGKGRGGCGAVLLVKPGDLTAASYKDVSGTTDTDYSFVCPECGVTTTYAVNPFYSGYRPGW